MHPENNFDTHAGTVTVENTGLSGVVVRLSGVSDASATTDASGRYSFTGLRMGNYSVEISGFDSDAVGFSSTASSTSVGVGESKIVSFDGTYLRTAGVSGQVSVEGEGLNGVMVSLRGGPDNVDESTTTDAAGQYAFASLRAGTYTVGISGWDDTDFEFEVTSKSVTVALGETGYVEFEGELLRTSGLAGRVSVGGMGMAGITVTLSGTADATANTDASGIYAFAGLAAGDYTVTISGYDAVEYSFDDSQDVTLEMDKTAIVNFDGMALRTASIKVMVTADGAGVAGVAATLTLVTSLNPPSGTIVGAGATDADGMHTFGPLLAGNYRVDISGADDEIDFADGMSWQGPVATDGMAEANFAGTINRTGSIAGMVTADGEGMGGVTVTLGGAGDASMMTADDGGYSFSGLRRGDYTVSVTNPNADMYSFPTTSRAVSVAIGQMHSDVSFAGTMIRRSSISGQVSVEGMGLDSVTVTLSGAHDATTMTDASGQYVFNGLGGGSYTVSFENPNGDAYEFDATSAEVMVGNAEAATQNFTGMHTRTASVSGMLFVDEVDSNDMYDEGEEMLAAADIEVALIGPTIAMRQTANTDAEGNFTFENLRMGTYQLVVGAEGVPDDYGYGGPATGYELEVGAGMTTTQNIPFDITHQTVAFSVMLKSGDMTGDALPGATVTLYADMEGKDRVASGETDEMGMASIRFARADAGGDMVYAGVMAPEGDFDVAGDMQMVSWASKDKMTAASNSQDVVNLKAEVSFAGKTITNAAGRGGMALAGWAIDVMMPGEGDEMVAVEGEDVPTMLDEEGMGSLTMMAESADDLPMTYYVQFDADQEGDLDGGEKYETVDKAMYTHTGLSLATDMDAGTATVRYTTQTLKVSVYREVDQVPGFTGNIGTKDISTTAGVELELRHETSTNRRGTFDPKVWVRSRSTESVTQGNYTFRNLPTDHNVFVLADEAADDVELLNPDNLAAFENHDDNGIMGSEFGSEGGYHHTVSLCPDMATDPTGQDFGECGSFAFVKTHTVAAHVKKNVVEMDDDDAFETDDEGNEVMAIDVEGVKLGFTPVTGKNMAGENESLATLKSAVRSAGEGPGSSTWDDEVDEKQDLYFGRMAEGVYTVYVSEGWDDGIGKEFRLEEGAVREDITGQTGASGPFRPGDERGVYIEVRPTTGILYGFVNDEDGEPLEGATVTVNGVTTETDIDGRYIAPDYRYIRSYSRHLYIQVSKDGYKPLTNNPTSAFNYNRRSIKDAEPFAANEPQKLTVELEESDILATVSGTVTDKDGDPVSGVDITVVNESDESVLMNPTRNCKVNDSKTDNCYKTGSDGTYTLSVLVTEDDEDYTITPSKDRYYFDNTDEVERLESGDEENGVDFEALRQSRIRGSVRGPDGGMSGVTVTATNGSTRTPLTFMDDTNDNGRFTIWVDGDERYDVAATPKDGYTFAPPDDAEGLRVDDDETHEIGVFTATTFMANDVQTTRTTTVTDDIDDNDNPETYTDSVKIEFSTGVTDGVTFTVEHDADGDGTWDPVGNDGIVSVGDSTHAFMSNGVVEDAFMVRVRATKDGADLNADDIVDAVNPVPTATTAKRDATSGDITVDWESKSTNNTNLRVIVRLNGSTEWWIAATVTSDGRTGLIDIDGSTSWDGVDGGSRTFTEEQLSGALDVRVQGTQDDADWSNSGGPIKSVPAHPST